MRSPAKAESEAAACQRRERKDGAKRNRTVDLLGFNQALFHLSYHTKKKAGLDGDNVSA